MVLDAALVEAACLHLDGKVHRTPVEESPDLTRRLGVPVWLKLECLQVTGSFKVRGALFRLSRLTEAERRAGVGTCSAGNHGKAIAYAAARLGLAATVYVPSGADESKRRSISELGAHVVVSKFPGYDDTELWAQREIERSGRLFVSAFDDEAIMAANGGTLASEVLDQVPDARGFLLPVGGGGLSSGFAFVVGQRLAEPVVVGCQLESSPALKLSLESGLAVTRLPAVETTAGGLEGGIGAKPFEVLRTRIQRVALLSEAEIFEAVRWMLDTHQYLIEPSAAVTIAACLTGKADRFAGPVVVVLSGRNVAVETLRRILV